MNVAIATVGIVAFVAITGFFGYKWLAHDEPDRAHACGSGSRGGLCIEGETTNMVLTVVFGVITVVTVALLLKSARSYAANQKNHK